MEMPAHAIGAPASSSWLGTPRARKGGLPDSHGRLKEWSDMLIPDLRTPGDAFDDLPRLGPAGTPPLGGHIREYAGVSTGLVERIREAIGDAVSPVLTEAVGRAILAVEDQLHGL
jgi:hypothetical protein